MMSGKRSCDFLPISVFLLYAELFAGLEFSFKDLHCARVPRIAEACH